METFESFLRRFLVNFLVTFAVVLCVSTWFAALVLVIHGNYVLAIVCVLAGLLITAGIITYTTT